MAISRVGSSASSANASSLSLNWEDAGGGDSPQSGDLALLFWNGQSGTSTWTASTSFTLLDAVVADTGSHEGRVYYRVCDGSETGTLTLTHTRPPDPHINKQSAVLRIWRGVDSDAPISDYASRDEDTSGTSHASPSVETVVDDEAIVVAIMERVTDSTANFAAPSGYTKLDQPTPIGGGGSTSLAVGDDGLAVSRPGGTTVTPGPWTNGVATANDITWTISLAPAEDDEDDLSSSDSGTVSEASDPIAADTPAGDSGALGETASLATTNLRYKIEVDWAGDGFGSPGDDVTRRTLERGSFTAEYGRDQARALSPMASGRASLEIDNRSRDYSPDNVDSPLYGNILPARPLRITAQQNGATYTLFRGHTDDYEIKPARNERSVAITGLDAVAMLKDAKVTTRLHQGIRTDQAIHVVLDAIGWPDTPLTANPYMADGTTGWNAVNSTIEISADVLSPRGTPPLKVTPDGVSAFCGADSDLTDAGTVTPGTEYVAYGQIYSPGGWATWRLNLLWYDAAGNLLSTTFGATTTVEPGVWQRFETRGTAPASASRASVAFRAQNTPSSSDVAYLWGVKVRDPNGDDPWRQFDVGATVIRWWWAENEDAFDVLQKIVASEGPPAMLHANEHGGLVFRSRHHRLLAPASVTAQATLTDTTEPAFSDFTYDHGWRDVVNAVAIKVDEYAPSDEPEPVWEDESIRNIGANETLELRVTLDNPVLNPTVSFETLSGSTSSAVAQDSGQTVTVEIAAGSGGATISNLVITAQPVTSHRTIDVQATEPSSIEKYGRRDYTHDAPWAGVHDAAAIADLIIGARAERRPIVNVTITSQTAVSSQRLAQQLARDLSDRIHITEPESCVDHDFHIEQIKHTAKQAGLQLDTEFGLERAATQSADVFRFDDADHGFDDGVFASTGLDDPAFLFIFDDADHGFDDGVFAT